MRWCCVVLLFPQEQKGGTGLSHWLSVRMVTVLMKIWNAWQKQEFLCAVYEVYKKVSVTLQIFSFSSIFFFFFMMYFFLFSNRHDFFVLDMECSFFDWLVCC